MVLFGAIDEILSFLHGVLSVQIANVKLFLFWYAELGEQFQVLNFYKTCKYTNNKLSDFVVIVEIKDLSQILLAQWVWPHSTTSAKDKSQKQILKAHIFWEGHKNMTKSSNLFWC